MKKSGESSPKKEPTKEEEYDDIMNYNFKIDFSKLSTLMKENTKKIKDHSDNIVELRGGIRDLITNKDNMTLRLKDCHDKVEQIQVNYNSILNN